jgi:hypothetical protein
MESGHLLQIIQPMLAGFKLDIAELIRKARLKIDLMLDEFEEVYAPDDDDEGKLVIAVLRQAARPIGSALGRRSNHRPGF